MGFKSIATGKKTYRLQNTKMPKKIFSNIVHEIWKSLKIGTIQNDFTKVEIIQNNANVIQRTAFPLVNLKRWISVKLEMSATK